MKIIQPISVGERPYNFSFRAVYGLSQKLVVKTHGPNNHPIHKNEVQIANAKEVFLFERAKSFLLNRIVARTEDFSQIVVLRCEVQGRPCVGADTFEKKYHRKYRNSVLHEEMRLVKKFNLGDLHKGNWGIRKGKLYIIDYESFYHDDLDDFLDSVQLSE